MLWLTVGRYVGLSVWVSQFQRPRGPALPTRSVMPSRLIRIWLPSRPVAGRVAGASRSTSQVVAAAVVAVVSVGATRRLLKVPLPAPTCRSSSVKVLRSTSSLKVMVMVVFSPERRSLWAIEALATVGRRGWTVGIAVGDAAVGLLQVPGRNESDGVDIVAVYKSKRLGDGLQGAASDGDVGIPTRAQEGYGLVIGEREPDGGHFVGFDD